MSAATRKNGNTHLTGNSVGVMRGSEIDPAHAVVRVDVEGRVMFGGGGTADQFGDPHLGFGGLEIGTIGIRALENIVDAKSGDLLEGGLLADFEFLTEWQADDAS